MSLMENQSRSSYSRRAQHRYSTPEVMIPNNMSTSLHQQQQPHSRRHSYHHHPSQGRRYTNHRPNNASNTTSSSFATYYSTFSSLAPSNRPFNTFEIVFTNLVDALIFTSAIAITAYNYWMGYISDPPRIYGPSSKSQQPSSSHITTHYSSSSSTCSSSQPPPSPSPSILIKKLDMPSPPMSLSPSSPSSPLPSAPPPAATWESSSSLSWLDLKRTDMEVPVPQTQQNVSSKTFNVTLSADDDDDVGPHEEEEEDRVNRMEETLQELIRQGQAALTSPY
ncbi:hypothetical protein BC941DRAFT_420317 [Chlamydoabsidia padenii]|nr:hypothetical protein BC941DRAFT_420317 [Chlamydoabsidia padenii]